MPRSQLYLSVALSLLAGGVGQADKSADVTFFETRIRPVLIEHCIRCHGPKKQESGIRLDHRSFLLKNANYGRPIVPGKPNESVLLQAIEHADSDLKMPEDGQLLPNNVINDFRLWIGAGAAWPDEPIPERDPPAETFDLEARKERLAWIWEVPPRSPLPPVTQSTWPRSAEDAFVLSKLEEKGMSPAALTAPEIWLRRVNFALTGLPPTPEAIHEFLAEPSEQAKSRAVDQLLASPSFGERWARHWMDLVRYAESRGHESDFLIANAWHYRDYLIQALNSDVPYDRFVVEHLAGDLVDKPRTDPATGANLSVLGTGWAFLGEEVHSPVDIRQDECDRVDNKVDVLSKTFLGLTVACARCHDHKFDAILQRDYYALSGFVLSSNFRQVRFESMEHNRRIASKLDRLMQQTRSELARLMADEWMTSGEHVAENLVAAMTGDSVLWKQAIEQASNDERHPLHIFAKAAAGEAELDALRKRTRQQADAARKALAAVKVLADYSNPEANWMQDGYRFGPRPQQLGDLLFGNVEQPIAGFATYAAAIKDPFWDSLVVKPETEKDSGRLAAHARAGRMIRTDKVPLGSGRLFYLMSGEANVYAGVDSHLMVIGPLHGHLTRDVKAKLGWHEHNVSVSEGDRAYVQFGAIPGKPLEVRMVVEADQPPQLVEAPSPIVIAMIESGDSNPLTLAKRYQAEVVRSLQLLGENTLVGAERAAASVQLLNWMLANPGLFPISDATQARLSALAAQYEAARESLRKQINTHSTTAVAWMDGNGVNERVLIRGKYGRPDQVAPRSLPTAFSFADPIEIRGSGRMELANQIVDPRNPLAARVIVNRAWHHLFGRGIVETVDNFGYLGSRPTHPELLDHMAWRFIHEDEWSIKRLVRRLVLSNTYAMSSRPANSQVEEVDPDNLWLHRMPVRRLEAEAIRDSVLAVSGRLDQRMLGKPIPVHHTEFVVGRGRPAENGPLDGAGRRSIYTSVRRNFLPTLMTTFDVPTPFSTVGRRNVTNVPGQALALMNDPLIYQQSELWAARTLTDISTTTDEARLRKMFLTAFGRKATTSELRSCAETLDLLQRSQTSSKQGAWRELCHVLLGSNEFIYIR